MRRSSLRAISRAISPMTSCSTTDPRFMLAVRAGVATMRFLPAEIDGRKVSQIVVEPFGFKMGFPSLPLLRLERL